MTGSVFADSAESSNVTVDTRTLTLNQLVVTGPSQVSVGADTEYTATLYYEGADPEDVTSLCDWKVTGAPLDANGHKRVFMFGNVLNTTLAQSTPVALSATIDRDNGRRTSSIEVTIVESSDLRAVLTSVSDPAFVQKTGVDFEWRITAEAGWIPSSKSDVTLEWFLDGAKIAEGESLDYTHKGQPGTKSLKVVATDGGGLTDQQIQRRVFNVPAAANEPKPIPSLPVGLGGLHDEDGGDFEFDPNKISNGLVIVTHGLKGNKNDAWLRNMAKYIRERLEAESPPNIILLGWGEYSDPTDWSFLDGTRLDILHDLYYIRPTGQTIGQSLASWIELEIGRGNVDAGKPVHLIGHSAGGFVMGECGYQLRNILSNIRVTMLDTPVPYKEHILEFPALGRMLDRYVSSRYGEGTDPEFFEANPPSQYYDYKVIMPGPLRYSETDHSYAYVWYNDSIQEGGAGTAGFGWSPFLDGSMAAASASISRSSSQFAPAQSASMTATPTVGSITGFGTFGSVVSVTDGYEIAEGNQANAGIMLADYEMPVGAQSISFRFQYTAAGDGDFLVVSHNGTVIGYGADNASSQNGEITVNMPVEHIAGQQGDLVFHLMSRGTQNAVVTVKGITLTTVDDADLDGILNVDEVTYGTNPLLADSDGDGLDDAYELNTSLTSPVLADSDGDGSNDGSELVAGTDAHDPLSKFLIQSTAWVSGDLQIQWSAVAGKTYRIIRSDSPSFENYDVIAYGIPGAVPRASYTDTDVNPTVAGRMFYRVEVE
ncbi:MAG: hypothetical protein H7A51_04895 [Akkermansiaceae bacterium]|nr:hypothetical protein [Akkermansiaceae bacterium]